MYASSATARQPGGSASRKAAQSAESISEPVGLFGSQIQAIRASLRRAASAIRSRSSRSSGEGTRSTIGTGGARGLGVEAVGRLRHDDRVAR